MVHWIAIRVHEAVEFADHFSVLRKPRFVAISHRNRTHAHEKHAGCQRAHDHRREQPRILLTQCALSPKLRAEATDDSVHCETVLAERGNSVMMKAAPVEHRVEVMEESRATHDTEDALVSLSIHAFRRELTSSPCARWEQTRDRSVCHSARGTADRPRQENVQSFKRLRKKMLFCACSETDGMSDCESRRAGFTVEPSH